ncbi:MAG: hypothetical protein KKG60_00280 [Nanoarchaeota archaeon]|nr:hypothetical protein [Nanoarchaeota archaeon]
MRSVKEKWMFLAIYSFLILFHNAFPVQAQEITLLGTKIPYILFVPLLIIVAGLLFFLVVFIKDFLPKLKIKRIKLHSRTKKKEQKKKELEDKTKYYRKSMKELKRKIKKLGPGEAIKEVSIFTKDFLGFVFDIPTQYSYEELIPKLKGHKTEEKLIEQLSEIVYGGEEIKKLQVNLMVSELENLMAKHLRLELPKQTESTFRTKLKSSQFFLKLHHLLHSKKAGTRGDLEPPKPGEFKKPGEIKTPKAKTTLSQEEQEELGIQKKNLLTKWITYNKNKRRKKEILNLLKFGRRYIKDHSKAARVYSRALLLYYRLPLKEEKEIMDEMVGFEKDMSFHKEQKRLIEIKNEMTNLKKNGKTISLRGISAIKNLAHVIKEANRKKEKKKHEKLPEEETHKSPKKYILADLEKELKKLRIHHAPRAGEIENIFEHKIMIPAEPNIKLIPGTTRKIELPAPPKKREKPSKNTGKKQKSSEKKQGTAHKFRKIELPVPPEQKPHKRINTLQQEKEELCKKLRQLENHNPQSHQDNSSWLPPY